MRLRRRRELPVDYVEVADAMASPEELVEQHALGEWVWRAIDSLSADERITVMLRYFTRCAGYAEIARVTAVPIGTVRSRLHRARTRLADSLADSAAGASMNSGRADADQYARWADFYRTVHDRPVAATYRELYAHDVDVRDTVGHWVGLSDWSAHEREAIALGVRARLLSVLASGTVTVLEIDFSNPPDWPDHCPPHATFVHRFREGRSVSLSIHYPGRAT
jgi:Sigma-70, region 4